MPQFDSHGSCFDYRGLDPYAQAADVTQCASCSALFKKQWTQQWSFANSSAYRNRSGSQGDSLLEKDTD